MGLDLDLGNGLWKRRSEGAWKRCIYSIHWLQQQLVS